MYIILVNNDNTMVTTQKEVIMKRSKLVDELWFLVPQIYKDHDMSNFTLTMEYVLPVSKGYKTETLVLSEDTYKTYLKYTLPFDTCLTAEAGDIEVQLTFTKVEYDTHGRPVQRVRKTKATTVTISPTSDWADLIPDEALNALDQRIIKQDAQINALGEYASMLNMIKADDIKYDKDANTIQLLSGATEIGTKVTLNNGIGEEGVPVITFGDNTESSENGAGSSTTNRYSNVIEF